MRLTYYLVPTRMDVRTYVVAHTYMRTRTRCTTLFPRRHFNIVSSSTYVQQ